MGSTCSTMVSRLSAPWLLVRVSYWVPAAVKVRWFQMSGSWLSQTVSWRVTLLFQRTWRWKRMVLSQASVLAKRSWTVVSLVSSSPA